VFNLRQIRMRSSPFAKPFIVGDSVTTQVIPYGMCQL
jgi:hypothetical protein